MQQRPESGEHSTQLPAGDNQEMHWQKSGQSFRNLRLIFNEDS